MGLKIYKIIDNNTAENNENNILLEFVCDVKLYDATDIFDNCLNYDSDNDDYYSIAEVYYIYLKDALNNLQGVINRRMNLLATQTQDDYIAEANRCYRVLSKALEGMSSGFFMLFI